MTFDALETSDGRPVEMYEFQQAGVFTRQTNAVSAQTIGGNTFEPLAGLTRTEPQINEELTSGETSVTVPHTFSIATQFRVTLPSTLPTLTVFRKHLNDPDDQVATVWKGDVASCKFGDNSAVLTCLPLTRVFDKPIPSRVFSATCNWQLYKRGCLVNRIDYTVTTTIGSADSTGLILTIDNLRTLAAGIDTAQSLGLTSAELDTFWNRGVVALGGSLNERRAVIETDVGGDPNVVKINRPYVATALAGAVCDVSAGCDHRIDQDCSRKFLNTPNFGGHPTVPLNNPFQIELDGGRTNNATPRIRIGRSQR